MTDKVAAIVLAAGFSSRMGEFKPLLPLGETTVLERTVTLFQEVGIRDVRVVTGHRSMEVAPLLTRLGARAIVNPRYGEGMFSSVAAGAATIGPEMDAFFVLPVDVPLVRPATIRALLNSYLLGQGDIIYPCFLGRRGHPPLIAARHAREIAYWHVTGGLREVLSQWESGARDVEVPDEQILCDMDTPDDYRLMQKSVARLGIPTEEECQVLLRNILRVDEHISRHGHAVAEVAMMLGRELNRAGCRLDIPLVAVACLLHDLAKGEPNHAEAGACLLRGHGFGAAADLVATHMDIHITGSDEISAGEVVYLADKLVQGKRRVSLAERFRTAMERHTHEPAILATISGRLKTAQAIQKRLEAVMGRSLEEVISPDEQQPPRQRVYEHHLSDAAR